MIGKPVFPGRHLPKRRLRSFAWGPLVENGFFQGMITAYVGAGLGLILFDAQGMTPPAWLLIDIRLSILCAFLAFARVWKSIREENETSEQWDDIGQSGFDRVLDRVVEIPYLFCLSVLPFTAIAPQAFMLTLGLFYVADNFYNAGLARGAAGLEPTGAPSYRAALWTALKRSLYLGDADLRGGRDSAMVDYFRGRSRWNSAFAGAIVLSTLLVTFLHVAGSSLAASWIAFLVLGAILVLEVFVEPRRNIDEDLWPQGGTVSVEDIGNATTVTPGVAEHLAQIHEEAFPERERQYSMGEMLGRAGQPDSIFRIIRFEDRIAGYIYLGLSPKTATAFLWYMAIEPGLRDRGIGQLAMTETLEMLRHDHPELRYVLFEVHPAGDDQADHALTADDRRIAFYLRLGAHRLRGVDYQLPAAGDRAQSITYDPMFFALRGTYEHGEIRDAVQQMASDNFEGTPDDNRWLGLKQSLDEMTVVSPSRVKVVGTLNT